MSDYPHIAPEFRHMLAGSAEERIEFVQTPRWIGYESASGVLDQMQRLLTMPTQVRTINLLIVGESNNGKSTLVRRFVDTCGVASRTSEPKAIKPVILAQSPPEADEKSLYLSILQRFPTPYRDSDPTSKLRYGVIHLLRRHEVRMLIIDDIHDLLQGKGSGAKQRQLTTVIKFLGAELAIPIVGVGTRAALRVLQTDPQLASRFDVRSLPLWELNPDFQKLLRDNEAVLPLKKPSKLYQREHTKLLFHICGGNLGNLRRLLNECAIEAIRSGTECIDAGIIDKYRWLRPTDQIRENVA